MSHIKCRKCGSREHFVGYGFAAGGLGGYTLCLDCNAVLEFSRDLEGMSEDDLEEMIRAFDQQHINEALSVRLMVAEDVFRGGEDGK